MKKRRILAALTAVACLMSGSSLVYADGAADVAAFLNAGYDKRHVTIFDGTSSDSSFLMMGKAYNQGIVFDDNRNYYADGGHEIAYVSYNVEDIDNIIFTLGHIDSSEGYDAYLDIYLDDVFTYRIYCGNTMNTARYYFDTTNVSSVRFYLDDTEADNYSASHFGMGNLVLNGDFTAVSENAYPNYLKIIELDKSKFGDLNQDGVVDSIDASLLLSAAASVGSGGESGLTQQLEIYADLDDSGAFDANDASTILQYAAAAGTGYEQGIDAFLKQ